MALVLSMAGILFFLAQTPREKFFMTFFLYSLVFGGMVGLFFLVGEKVNFSKFFLSGLLLRLAVFWFQPQWSDDFYRFLWDGELVKTGQNPYGQTPREWHEENPGQMDEHRFSLFENLNSRDYHSVYPPLNQVFFLLGAEVSDGLISKGYLMIRFILLLGEIGVFILLWKLLAALHLPRKMIFWYWLNPFVVMELIGNLHFEGLVFLFLLASVWVLQKGKLVWSGGFWGLAVGIKLLPMLLAPAFLAMGKTGKSVSFWIGAITVIFACFAPLLTDQSWLNLFQSIRLFQGKFEFNASIYFLVREIGYWVEGYNVIGYVIPYFSAATGIFIGIISWKRRPKTVPELVNLWVLIYLIYLLLQPVVHPWYILPGLGLSLLTGKKTLLFWSFGVIFSYQAYGNVAFEENPVFILLEYGLVVFGIFLDYFLPKRKVNFGL
jgi:alpha-1,6-mannosyltransferase